MARSTYRVWVRVRGILGLGAELGIGIGIGLGAGSGSGSGSGLGGEVTSCDFTLQFL